jgi:hypothetical protein
MKVTRHYGAIAYQNLVEIKIIQIAVLNVGVFIVADAIVRAKSNIRKPTYYCEYCLVNKTTRLVECEDGADYPCCKDCYKEWRSGAWD